MLLCAQASPISPTVNQTPSRAVTRLVPYVARGRSWPELASSPGSRERVPRPTMTCSFPPAGRIVGPGDGEGVRRGGARHRPPSSSVTVSTVFRHHPLLPVVVARVDDGGGAPAAAGRFGRREQPAAAQELHPGRGADLRIGDEA